jgi:hypothetical protein
MVFQGGNRAICSERVEIYKEGAGNFLKISKVGDGSRVYFWHDVWFGEQSLKKSYLDLFTIALCKGTQTTKLLSMYPQ